MSRTHRIRLAVATVVVLLFAAVPISQQELALIEPAHDSQAVDITKYSKLDSLAVKGRAPKTGYERDRFGNDWQTIHGCSMRNIILARDLDMITTNDECEVMTGILDDPYTGKRVQFMRGQSTSNDVQIDHVVALSNAWQTGAQYKKITLRTKFANDPLNLLAVDGEANQQKSDGDAATWLPPNKAFRCQYVTRQINVKKKYGLWVTPAEKSAMVKVLSTC